MQKKSISKWICKGAILTAFTVLFQAAPVFLPIIGLILSPFSTLPIALATFTNLFLGFTVLLSSVFLLAFISIEETLILLFTTGLLGLVIGALLYRKGMIISVLGSSLALLLGILVLTYVIGMSAFVDITHSLQPLLIIFLFFSFSLVYVSIWNIYFKKFIKFLKKTEKSDFL